MPNNFRSLLIALGKGKDVALALGVRETALSNMKGRNSVTPSLWDRLVELAAAKGIDEITKDQLHEWYTDRLKHGSTHQPRPSAAPAADDASSARERAA